MGPRQGAQTETANTPRGSDLEVRPTTPADTAEICDLLEHGFGIPADHWRPLCTTNWLADKPRGFVLTDGGRIVGHVGLICVQREINGKTGIVCNHSGFYVAPDYRGRGLGATLSAAAVGRDERITHTSLTPAPVTQRILEASGWSILDRHVLLFPPGLNAETLWQSRVDIDVNDRTVRASLGQAERRIYDDHASYDCLHMTACDAGGTAYLVVKRRLRRTTRWAVGIPLSQILYCSAPDVLARNLERIKLAIMWQQKTFGIAMNERLFPKAPRAIRREEIAQYRSAIFTPDELDLLYSEFVLLDI